MPNKRRVFPEEREAARKNAIQKAAFDIEGAVCFYEQWHDEETFVFADGYPHPLPKFCQVVWQDEFRRSNCYKNHHDRIATYTGTGISSCWLNVDNVCCHVKDKLSEVTLLGGYFRIEEDHDKAQVQLQKTLADQPDAEMLEQAWRELPEISKQEALSRKVKALKTAGKLYLQRLQEINDFRSVTDNTTHDLAAIMQILIAEIETLQIELKETFHIGKKWEQRFEALINLCEQHADYLDKSLEEKLRPGSTLYQPHSISRLIYDCADIYMSKAQAKDVEIRVNLEQQITDAGEHKVMELCMDRVALRQAIQNVIDNAVKYSFSGTCKGSRWVDIIGRLYTISGRQGYQITVQNLGVGIEPDELIKVFEPHYQGRRRINEGRRGHGMGLSFVKNMYRPS